MPPRHGEACGDAARGLEGDVTLFVVDVDTVAAIAARRTAAGPSRRRGDARDAVGSSVRAEDGGRDAQMLMRWVLPEPKWWKPQEADLLVGRAGGRSAAPGRAASGTRPFIAIIAKRCPAGVAGVAPVWLIATRYCRKTSHISIVKNHLWAWNRSRLLPAAVRKIKTRSPV